MALTRPFGPAEVAAGDIRSVRFAETTEALLKEWDTLSATASDSDRLVLVRDESLNYHAGIVRGLSADRVEFDLDGELLRVKRSNVLGVIYHRAAGRELPPNVATLVDTTGSRWAVRSLSFDAGVFRVTTPAGTALECPADQMVEIDFSEGKVVHLGELPWRLIEWTPYFGLREELPARKAFFAPRFDRSAAGSPLMLDSQRYARGVTLRSRTEIEFDLPEGYRRFKAIVGIDDAFRPHGDARVIVRGDDRVLAETNPAGTRPAEWIDVDITGLRRLSIVVDFGQDMDLGDQVDLCEARIVK
ncbi:MAG TPA: hypothetical protein DD670_10395 [Planctomycetaceae bacterium]|nr:hypothetical protein [Planctomycetaceae bacterium]